MWESKERVVEEARRGPLGVFIISVESVAGHAHLQCPNRPHVVQLVAYGAPLKNNHGMRMNIESRGRNGQKYGNLS